MEFSSQSVKTPIKVPVFSVNLGNLKTPTKSTTSDESTLIKLNAPKIKKTSLKTKVNYERLKEMQQVPKISSISKMLTSPNSLKDLHSNGYVGMLIKNSSKKKLINKEKKIDYSGVKSLSEFAISKTMSSSVVYTDQSSNGPKEKCNEKSSSQDMYARGQSFLKQKPPGS